MEQNYRIVKSYSTFVTQDRKKRMIVLSIWKKMYSLCHIKFVSRKEIPSFYSFWREEEKDRSSRGSRDSREYIRCTSSSMFRHHYTSIAFFFGGISWAYDSTGRGRLNVSMFCQYRVMQLGAGVRGNIVIRCSFQVTIF